MKIIKKMNEKEKYLNYKSAHNGFIFYAVALLIWSVYSQFTSKEPISWQHTIWIVGISIYFLSNVYYRQKMNKEKSK